MIKFTFKVTPPSPVYNHTSFEACGWCYFGGVCAPSESEDSSRCVCAPGYYGSHCQGEQIIFDTLLRISRNYICLLFQRKRCKNYSVRIQQCESDDDCVYGGSCEVDEIEGPMFCRNCDPGFTGPLCDCKFEVLTFQKKYHALVNSMKQIFGSL